MQYQLGVAHLNQGSIGWLTQGREFGYQDLRLVPDFFAWLIEEVERFWRDNILGGAEPAQTSVRDVLLKYDRHTDGKVIEVGEDVARAYDELKDLRRDISALEERKLRCEDTIKLAFADAEAISYGGQTLARFKAPKPSAKFDAKAFRADHPDLADQYTHEVQGSRRLTIL